METQSNSRSRLQNLCRNGFDGNEAETGLVLGRTESEIRAMLAGEVEVDEDLDTKINGIADERGIDIGGALEE